MPEDRPFPQDGEGLPDYSAINQVGLDPVLVAQSSQLVTELAALVAQQQETAVQTRIDLEKLKSLIGIAERLSTDILPVLAGLAERYMGPGAAVSNSASRTCDLIRGPLSSLLQRPEITQLGQDVLTRIIEQIRSRTGM